MKINKVQQSRKKYRCHHCNEPIAKGEPYIWWNPIDAGVVKWHAYHGNPPRSAITSSRKKVAVYQQQEALIDYLTGIQNKFTYFREPGVWVIAAVEEICELLENFNELATDALMVCEEISNQYYGSAENMRKRFGETPLVVNCYMKSDKITDWIGVVNKVFERLIGLSDNLKQYETITFSMSREISRIAEESKTELGNFSL